MHPEGSHEGASSLFPVLFQLPLPPDEKRYLPICVLVGNSSANAPPNSAHPKTKFAKVIRTSRSAPLVTSAPSTEVTKAEGSGFEISGFSLGYSLCVDNSSMTLSAKKCYPPPPLTP